MSWLHHAWSRRKALTTASGPVAAAPADQYTNPVPWQGFDGIDIIRVGDTYYRSASTMHCSPGAPVLRSHDLVDGQFFTGHRFAIFNYAPQTLGGPVRVPRFELSTP